MIAARTHTRIGALSILLIGLVVTASPGHAGRLELKQLMGMLAQVRGVDARFRETKALGILKKPLVQTGILRYRAPDYLKKQVLRPARQSVEIDGDRVYIDRPSQDSRRLSLHDYPAVRAFVASVRATLAGNLPALERYYHVRLEGAANAWRLHLAPRNAKMKNKVAAIVIHGSRQHIRSIETLQPRGERSVMTITSTRE